MLSKEAILRTKNSYWSEEDGCFVTESALLPRTAGIGNSRAESEVHFARMLEGIYADYAAGNLHGYDKRGRPSKGIVSMHVQVRPSTKQYIDNFAGEIDISQGDAIEYFVSYYRTQSMSAASAQVWSVPIESESMPNDSLTNCLSGYMGQFQTPSELGPQVEQVA